MSQNLPSVSVVIPARDAAAYLPAALAAIQSQTYGNIVDTVVAAADHESADAARGATVVDNQAGTTPAGLNLAIDSSQGEIVVRCDAHAVLPPDYVRTAVEILMETGADVVGGMQVPRGHSDWGKAIARAMTSRFGAGDARYRIGGDPGPVETVYLGVFRRQAIERVGGFDEEFVRSQDYELNHRIIQAGGIVWFDPRLQVTYDNRDSLWALAKQYFAYGRGKRLFNRKHPGNLRWRQLAPPTLTVALLTTLLASILLPALIMVPLLYAVGLIAASRGSGRVATALAVMHTSWGSGFLVGK